MVSAEVRRQFAERAVALIDPEAGGRAFGRELVGGTKGQAEVILGGGPWACAADAPAALPLLGGAASSVGPGGSLVATCVLDPDEHLYLDDHRLDGKPVLPATVAMELMAETAQKGWPEWHVVAVRSLQVLKGVVLEGGGADRPAAGRLDGRSRPRGLGGAGKAAPGVGRKRPARPDGAAGRPHCRRLCSGEAPAMQTVSAVPDRAAIVADVIGIIGEMTRDWEVAFAGENNEDTLLLAGLSFQSIGVVMLVGELHRLYGRTDIPFERLLLSNGRPVEDLRIGTLVGFLVEQLRA
jgi:hypothetical protein